MPFVPFHRPGRFFNGGRSGKRIRPGTHSGLASAESACRKEQVAEERADTSDGRSPEEKCDKKHLVMYVNAPSENRSERYGMYVSIRKLYFAPRGTAGTFSALDYGGNNSTSFFARRSSSTRTNSSSPEGEI